MDENNVTANSNEIALLNLDLTRDNFLVNLVESVCETLEEVVGLEEASGFISVVGAKLGESINEDYLRHLSQTSLSPELLATVLVDLKRRVGGDFDLVSVDHQRIVLSNKHCPFGDKVIGHESMCMMTSNVFGRIIADNLGYANVELNETIARGNKGCRVIISLDANALTEVKYAREYFRA